jgi:CRISPR-associated protein Cmr2
MNKEELFLYKVGALFHDPPDKAWIITGKLEAPSQPEGKKAHERRAQNLAAKILRDTCLEKVANEYNSFLFSNIVMQSDRFASSVDRLFLEESLPNDKKGIVEKDIRIKNTFNPHYEKSILQEISENDVSKFTSRLKDVLSGINDTRLAYFVLYAFYELAWIKSGLPVSPADTRVPTHSVFDHNYATASAVNFFIDSNNGNPNGLVIAIDVPSVQEYIKSSRKLRDLWASSYLVSLLVWSTVKEFVKLYGPDILILPTTRFNPFFYHFVLSELYQYFSESSQYKEIEDFLSIGDGNIKIFDIERGYPRFAVIPATVTIFLPSLDYLNNDEEMKELMRNYGVSGSLDKDRLENLIKEIFKKKWNMLYQSIVKGVNENEEEGINKLNKYLIKKLEEVNKIFEFDSIPPFDLRVVVLKIPDELSITENNLKPTIVYAKMFDKIKYELARKKYLKVKSFAMLRLTQLTQDIYDGKQSLSKNSKSLCSDKNDSKGFEYCTNCGILPAIVQFPTLEYKNFLKECIGLSDEEEIDEFTIYYSQGEKLCPYCLIKRMFTIEECSKVALENLLGKVNAKFKLRMPSLADISTYEFKDKLINKLKDSADKVKLNELDKLLTKILLAKIRKREIKYSNWLYIDKKIREIGDSKLDDRDKANLETVLIYESENLFFEKDEKTNRKRDWEEFAKSLNLNISPGTYYALVRSDADNMGKLVSGRINKFGIDFLEYLKSAYHLKDIMSENEINNMIEKIISDYKEQLKSNSNEDEILISLSYHSALSRALMLNALYDAYNIENKLDGFIIYSGGDDLLALIPVSKALEAVKCTRETFELGDSQGFYKLNNNYFVPTLVITGRSYSLYIAHYKYPMYAVVTNSNSYLDGLAKESEWIYRGGKKIKKDSLVIVYSPRGGEISAILPLKEYKGKRGVEVLIEIVNKINNGKFTNRLVYELYDEDNLLRWYQMVKNKDILIRDIISHAKRHVKDKQHAEEELKFLQDYLDEIYDAYYREIDDEEKMEIQKENYLFYQLFKSIRAYLGGLRGE